MHSFRCYGLEALSNMLVAYLIPMETCKPTSSSNYFVKAVGALRAPNHHKVIALQAMVNSENHRPIANLFAISRYDVKTLNGGPIQWTRIVAGNTLHNLPQFGTTYNAEMLFLVSEEFLETEPKQPWSTEEATEVILERESAKNLKTEQGVSRYEAKQRSICSFPPHQHGHKQ